MMEGKRVSGNKIRQARLRAGMTQSELARKVGVSERNIVRWEGGRHQPRLEHVVAIAEACGVHVADLLDSGPDDETPVTREQRLLNVGLAIEALVVEGAS
jgi:transcriptional regulator with XRE-family HTH domain